MVKWYHFTLGHCGLQKLYDTIMNQFYYYPRGLYKICESFICPINCEKSKSRCDNKEYGHLAPRHAIVAPWNEVHVDCVGPWTITATNEAKYVFSALTCIDPVTNLVDIILMDGSNPRADYCGERFKICWLSRYPKPNRCIYDNGKEFIGSGFQEILSKHKIRGVPTTVKIGRAHV